MPSEDLSPPLLEDNERAQLVGAMTSYTINIHKPRRRRYMMRLARRTRARIRRSGVWTRSAKTYRPLLVVSCMKSAVDLAAAGVLLGRGVTRYFF